MEPSALLPYGFVYEHDGKRFAFDILAESREEAKARLASMAAAACIGELRQSGATAVG